MRGVLMSESLYFDIIKCQYANITHEHKLAKQKRKSRSIKDNVIKYSQCHQRPIIEPVSRIVQLHGKQVQS